MEKKELQEERTRAKESRARCHKKIIRNLSLFFCLLLLPIFIILQKTMLANAFVSDRWHNILLFTVININILLFLILFFLILRYLAEYFFDEREKNIATKLKTKILFSFLSLTLIPALLLFFVALKFVSTSMDYWFDSSVEESLTESLALAQSILENKRVQAKEMNSFLLQGLKEKKRDEIENYFAFILNYHIITGVDALRIKSINGEIDIIRYSPRLRNMILPETALIQTENIYKKEEEGKNTTLTTIDQIQQGALVNAITPLSFHFDEDSAEELLLISSMLVPSEQLQQMNAISGGIEDYRQLKYFKEPVKFWLVIILLVVTLLVIFAAIWFAFSISRGLTAPLEHLVRATQRVAEGDWEFEITSTSYDEMAELQRAFNQMTTRLKSSNAELQKIHSALQLSSQESEQRRRYTEIILQNVSAGVISVEKNGVITTINRFAQKLLQIDSSMFIGRNFTEVLPPYQAQIVQGFIDDLRLTGKNTVEQHLRLNVMGKAFSLLINFTRLETEENEEIGYVLVFDNLTKLEKMQRMAAWREVARRIAHEIKNPLTPIKLSAQRLRKRYPEIVAEENSVFDQCTNTIIVQVEELRRLVGEFSKFARMPKVQKSENDLVELTQETLFLYIEGHPKIDFQFISAEIPSFYFDKEQIKRCIINLLDNAVAVLPNGGKITVLLQFDREEGSVFIEVADNGPGIKKEDKLRLFEPYFSTKKSGTGLGLAIVSTIVSDHSGYIRVQDNYQKSERRKGSRFIIELPFKEKRVL